MLIDPKQMICGVKSTIARDVVRQFPEPSSAAGRSWHSACRVVRDENEAQALVEALVAAGYLTVFARMGNDCGYARTEEGCRLSLASARPLKRARADIMLKELIDRAHQINENPELCYFVPLLVVFGSYMDPNKQVLGDLDIGYGKANRFSDEGPQFQSEQDRACERRIRVAIQSGRSFGNMVERIFWPQTEVLRALKGRAAGLSLHEIGDEGMSVIFGGPFRVVYSLPTDHPALHNIAQRIAASVPRR